MAEYAQRVMAAAASQRAGRRANKPHRPHDVVGVGVGQEHEVDAVGVHAGLAQLAEYAVAASGIGKEGGSGRAYRKAGVVASRYEGAARAEHSQCVHLVVFAGLACRLPLRAVGARPRGCLWRGMLHSASARPPPGPRRPCGAPAAGSMVAAARNKARWRLVAPRSGCPLMPVDAIVQVVCGPVAQLCTSVPISSPSITRRRLPTMSMLNT